MDFESELERLRNNDYLLTTLNLNYYNLGIDGAKTMVEALKVNSTLTSLNLYLNNIGVKGAEKLAEALEVNNTLKVLDLSYNDDIGDEGVISLAKALEVNHTLKKLNLDGNIMWINGATALIETLKTNYTLIDYDHAENVYNDDRYDLFDDLLEEIDQKIIN